MKIALWTTALAVFLTAALGAQAPDTIYFGVSGPQTGKWAEYGRLWKQGFDLALEKINTEGGLNGHPVGLKWEDSQSDPKQTVAIAQKFVADPSIIAELGDFSSPASMAASPTYEAAGLVQYGFTNSHPDFTKGGEHTWSPSLTQVFFQSENARLALKYGKTAAVLYQETDWGKTAFDLFSQNAQRLGLKIVFSSAFLPDSTDFRPVLIKARDAKPDVFVHLGYGPDGALIVKQLRDLGYAKQVFAGQNTPEFISLVGKAGEGDILAGSFLVDDPRPRIKTFVEAFRKKFSVDPGDFNVYAYDAVIDLVEAAKAGGVTREGVLKGLKTVKAFSSVQFGSFAFDENRRPGTVQLTELILKNGKFVPNLK